MSEESLQRGLLEAQQAILMFQEELAETNQGLIALVMKLEDQVEEVTVQLEARVEQQIAVATISRSALACLDIDELLAETIAVVSRVLGVDHCIVFEERPGEDRVGLRAPASIGDHVTVPAATQSAAGFVLESCTVVTTDDFRTETRFVPGALVDDIGARSGTGVLIAGKGRPRGVLAVYSNSVRAYASDEVLFLKTVAYVIAAALAHEHLVARSSESPRIRNPSSSLTRAERR